MPGECYLATTRALQHNLRGKMISIAPDEVIGFVGTGVMGRHMASHIIHAGYPLIVYSRTRSKAEPLIAEGARWANSPGEVAREAKVVCTMVGYPADVEQIYLGEDGILANGKEGGIFCDFTTSSPELAIRIARGAEARNIMSVDAPVSGGDVGARDGTLSIMCGGNEDAFDALLPILQIVGRNIVYQGVAGTGQHAKMCNQIAVAGTMAGVIEALVYARESGLNPGTVLQAIAAGAAGSWSMSNLAPRVLDGNFEPGFYVEHFIKDMDIALAESERMGVELPGLTAVRSLYEKVAEMGLARKGTQALYLAYGKEE
jgi:3-hydroxyisobutyrate dehydrogenase